MEKALDDHHTDLEATKACGRTLARKGNVFWSMGYFEKALWNYKKALKIIAKTRGLDGPDAADILYNIALVHGKLEEHDPERFPRQSGYY